MAFAATIRHTPVVGEMHSPCGFNAGDANLNRYCENNPTNYTDPSGLEKIKVKDNVVYWVIQHNGIGGQNVREISIGRVAGDDVNLDDVYGGATIALDTLKTYASDWWKNGHPELDNDDVNVQNRVLRGSLRALAEEETKKRERSALNPEQFLYKHLPSGQPVSLGTARGATFDPNWDKNRKEAVEQAKKLARLAVEFTAMAGVFVGPHRFIF
jgi:hypothetical protein